MAIRLLTSLAAAAVLVAAVPAQLAGPGLTWTGGSGAFAGSYLPSCSNLAVKAPYGDSVQLRVWGDVGAPFALLAAASGTQCLPIAGLGNALVLDPPLLSLGAGVLNQTTPCLSCPPGFAELRFTVPKGAPPGTSVSLQAISFGAGRPAFTVAVSPTVG